MSTTQDYLDEDPVIPSQRYYCVSFFNKITVKQSIDNNNDYQEEVFGNTAPKENYSTDNNVFGLKIRGGFPTLDDAKAHAKRLTETIDPYHHVYVFDGGKWGGFVMKESDSNELVEQTEYTNNELNDMMKKYKENQDKAKVYHELRKNQMIVNNIDDNLRNREELLLQTKEELKNCDNRETRKTIKEKLASIDDQISKMQERKNELQTREKELTSALNMGVNMDMNMNINSSTDQVEAVANSLNSMNV